ncbi:Ldh family oxidoreductase [Paracoccus sp. M683]|uniref:Ldh family oxidoreductase n=1 Tax=Paracoccus sp. M683 TaxID=2594268 RepID=UPI00117C3CC6|nr:Ldh family oxidoreductase [Paracoccus sp. M683]TRW97847.1 Ldh family oxidoreductase [Paracoccus sp. M683]
METAEYTIIYGVELQNLASAALVRLGVENQQAGDAAKVLTLADMMGVHTHGVGRVLSYGERLKIGGINAKAQFDMTEMAPALAVLDGDNGLGPAVGMKALNSAMAMAETTGIACVLVHGSNHFGPVAPYAWLAAEQGFASFICSNATTTIAPTGGKQARLGNNPLGFGFPAPGGDPVILDMAMSVAARARIRNAAAAGQQIPEGWATDSQGLPTTDPAAALRGFLLPLGGYKGYGLSLCVDLLAGVLANAAYLTHVKSWVDAPGSAQDLGHSFILIDTRKLMPATRLADRMTDFASILHETPPVNAEMPVMLPGEREMRSLNNARQDGIRLDGALVEKLRAIAQS